LAEIRESATNDRRVTLSVSEKHKRELGPILRNSISAGNLSEKFSPSNFEQASTNNQNTKNYPSNLGF
jgi:hypothetical protein